MNQDQVSVKGTVRIYKGKKEKLLHTFDNLFLDVGKQKLFNLFVGKEGETPINYTHLAIGRKGTKPTGDMTKMKDEWFRKKVHDVFIDEGSLFIETYIESFEANFTWLEVGLFESEDDGLLNGTLYNYSECKIEKNDGEAVTVSWEVKIL